MKNWAFTAFNQTDDFEWWKNVYEEEKGGICYMIVGKETTKEGRKHMQGYVQFKDRQRKKPAKKKLQCKPHVEPAWKEAAKNIAYCRKEKDWQEWGEAKSAGQRTDMRAAMKDVKETNMVCQFVQRQNYL